MAIAALTPAGLRPGPRAFAEDLGAGAIASKRKSAGAGGIFNEVLRGRRKGDVA